MWHLYAADKCEHMWKSRGENHSQVWRFLVWRFNFNINRDLWWMGAYKWRSHPHPHNHHHQYDLSAAVRKTDTKAVNRLYMPFNISWAGTLKLSCIFKSSTKSITRAFSVQAFCALVLWKDKAESAPFLLPPPYLLTYLFLLKMHKNKNGAEIYFHHHYFDTIITVTHKKKWNKVMLNQLRVLKKGLSLN